METNLVSARLQAIGFFCNHAIELVNSDWKPAGSVFQLKDVSPSFDNIVVIRHSMLSLKDMSDKIMLNLHFLHPPEVLHERPWQRTEMVLNPNQENVWLSRKLIVRLTDNCTPKTLLPASSLRFTSSIHLVSFTSSLAMPQYGC